MWRRHAARLLERRSYWDGTGGGAVNGLENKIAAAARAQGFTLVGFAALRELPRAEFYSRWLADQRHGEMAYLAREPERRFDPRRLDSRLRSVISLGFPYQAPAPVKLDWRR